MSAPSRNDPARLRELCERFADEIEQAPHNLMSARGLAELRTRHLPECLAFARMLPTGPARVIDVGSGGGLPGIVVALARPDLDVHLLEATAKKAKFLEEVSRRLEVPTTVHAQRAEMFARGAGAAAFDVVTARAVAALPRLVQWAMPLLKPGGSLFAIKGERWRDELEAAAPVIERCRALVIATPDDQPSPGPDDPRVIIVSRALASG